MDVCASFSGQNLQRILTALADLSPRFAKTGHREALPADAARLAGFKNLYVDTNAGQIDFLSAIHGVGGYGDVVRCSVEMDFDLYRGRVIDLDTLSTAKRAAGHPKDLQVAIELEAIRSRLP